MNKSQIIKMLEYCGLSYNNIQPESPGETLYSFNDKETDVCYHIRIKNDTLTIVFRGSDSEKDWSFNMNFYKKTIPYGNCFSPIKVHSGFLKAYKSKNVRNRIKSFVADNINKITVSGHSYGAALAILCAADLQYNFPTKDYEVIVFGCPRVGNAKFRDSYNKRIFKTVRIENSKDIVTKVPFKFMGYRHVGTRIKLKSKNILSPLSMHMHTLQQYYANIWCV